MIVARIEGATRTLGQQQGYLGLPIRDEYLDDTVTGPKTPVMTSAWEPTPDELQRLLAGAKVILQVVGTAHPPVLLTVGPAP